MRTTFVAVVLGGLGAGLVLAGCGGGGGGVSARRAAAGAGAAAAPGAVNVLLPTGAPAAPGAGAAGPAVAPVGSSASAPAASATAASATTASTPGAATAASATTASTPGVATTASATAPGATATPGAPAGGLPTLAGVAATTTAAALRGTIPARLTTGFDGQLYFVGERLAPGSFFQVSVNGVPTKVLPAVFYSSELLSTYVCLTVPADYEFVAVAPDGSRSTPARFTVTNGGTTTLLGLAPPDVQMVFPTALDPSVSGVVWLLGDQFMPGSVVTVSQPGLPTYVAPLLVTNERTAGWMAAGLVAGSVTLTVTNPTLLSAAPVTLVVGPAPAGGAATPRATFPPGVSAPFLGSVHVLGSGLELGAVVELRPVTAAGAPAGPVTSTPLVRTSSAEGLWTLLYPAPGAYEVRVVNPSGAASPWRPFDVQ